MPISIGIENSKYPDRSWVRIAKSGLNWRFDNPFERNLVYGDWMIREFEKRWKFLLLGQLGLHGVNLRCLSGTQGGSNLMQVLQNLDI